MMMRWRAVVVAAGVVAALLVTTPLASAKHMAMDYTSIER